MVGAEEFSAMGSYFSPSTDPIVLELNRLQNQLRDKDREIAATQGVIKTLKVEEHLKEKAVKQLNNELNKVKEKLQLTEMQLEQRNLEIKKLIDEKKEAVAAQFAAEAALRRIHATQNDDDSIPIDAVIAPLEADIKMYKNQVAMLQEDNKALERLNKSKEAALVEANDILKTAMERAVIVDELQNHNFELKRQIEIYQEEYRILDKVHRQKVSEVEKLSHTIQELEESILSSGTAANAIRDFQRQISELKEERRSLERELARVKVSANRVATVVANDWKDDSEKVMPVKQWLEERKYLQGELQRLKEKLAASERSVKAEAQLKDKLQKRLRVLEEGLKHALGSSANPNVSPKLEQAENPNNVLGFLPNNIGPIKRSTSQPRACLASSKFSLLQPNVALHAANSAGLFRKVNSLNTKYGSGENMMRKNLWASGTNMMNEGDLIHKEVSSKDETDINSSGANGPLGKESLESENADYVSGFMYDTLQREVISLRKTCKEKDGKLDAKDNDIKILKKKIDALTKAKEAEVKKLKREATSREKEMVSTKSRTTSKGAETHAIQVK